MSENRVISQNVDVKKCRLCLCHEKLLIYLYEDSGMPKNVAKVISGMLHHEVSELDGFPPYICTACSDKLWEFKAFKLMCDSAFEVLLEEKERRSEISPYVNANAVEEEPVVNDSTSHQCSRDEDNTELQVPEGVLQPRERTNAQLYHQSVSLKSNKTLNSQDSILYSNKLEGNKVVTNIKSHIKTMLNQKAKNEKSNPKGVKIVDRGDAILNDNMIGSLQSSIDKNSPQGVRSEELLDEIIVLRNYGVKKRQAVVLSSDTDTSSGDETFELSSGDKKTARKMSHEFNSGDKGSDLSSKNVSNGMRNDLDALPPDIRGRKTSSRRLSDELMKDECPRLNQVTSLSDSNSSSSSCCIDGGTSPIPSDINVTNEPKISCESYDISKRESTVAYVSSKDLLGKFVSENLCIKKEEEKKSGVRDEEPLLIFPLIVDLEKDEMKEQQSYTSVPKYSSVIGVTSGGDHSGEFFDESTNESLNNQEMFEKIKYTKGDSRPYKCEICSQSFTKLYTFERHINTHSKEETHICSICSEGFQSRYKLMMHLDIHTGGRMYYCQHCFWYSKDKKELKDHVKQTHLWPKKCGYCGLTFRTNMEKNKHKKLHRIRAGCPKYRSAILCELCGFTFTTVKQRNRHRKKHGRVTKGKQVIKGH